MIKRPREANIIFLKLKVSGIFVVPSFVFLNEYKLINSVIKPNSAVENRLGIIKTDLAPKAIGAYSQGILYDNIIFTSGQIPIDINNGNIVSDDFKTQLVQVLNNLKKSL